MSFNHEIKKYFFYGVSILFLFLISSLAYAGSSIFPVAPEDASINVIKYLFGSILPSGLSGGADPFGQTIQAFNTAVLTIGGILAGYTMLVGTVNTAHDGEMLGKKFSSAWVPFRTAVGTLLVLPVFSGYCLMQVLVMWLVVQGIGMANLTWTAFLGTTFTVSSYETIVPSPKVNELVQKTYMSMICAQGYKKVGIDNPQTQSILGASWGYTKVTSGLMKGGYTIGNNANPFEKSACGQILPRTDAVKTTAGTKGASNSAGLAKSGYGTPTIGNTVINEKGKYASITAAHESATAAMLASTEALAIKTIAGTPVAANELTNIAKTYELTVESAVKSELASGNDPFKNAQTTATKEGWMMAGSWFMKLINSKKEIKSKSTNTPVIAGSPKAISSTSSTAQQVNTYLIAGQKQINNDVSNAKSGLQQAVDDDLEDNDMAGRFMAWLGEGFTGIDIMELEKDTRHPIVIMTDMGESLITAVPLSIAALLLIYTGGGILAGNIGGKLGGLDTAFGAGAQFLSLLAVPILLGMLGMGFTLAFFIPMLPFTIWIGALIGWLILVVEAVIAAPLWAIMHLHPSGEDVTGRGGQGYTIVLSLVLKPVLMIFGLGAAIILAEVFGGFINKVFFNTMFLAMDEGQMGFWSTFFGLIIYIGIMLTFVKKTFDIIHIIPDQLLRWIGGGGPGLGESAGKMSQGTEGKAAAVGAFIGGQAGTGFNTGINRAQLFKSNKLQQENNDKQYDMAHGAKASEAKALYVKQNGGRSATSFDNGINIAQSIGGKEGASEYISHMNAGGDRDDVLQKLQDKYLAGDRDENKANVANIMGFAKNDAGVTGSYGDAAASKLQSFKSNYNGSTYTAGLEKINDYVNTNLKNSTASPADKQTMLLSHIDKVMAEGQDGKNDVIAAKHNSDMNAEAISNAIKSVASDKPSVITPPPSPPPHDDGDGRK